MRTSLTQAVRAEPQGSPGPLETHRAQERVENDYLSRLTAALTSVRGINKTDAVVLGSQFGRLGDILRAGKEDLSACPGIGPTKVQQGVGCCKCRTKSCPPCVFST